MIAQLREVACRTLPKRLPGNGATHVVRANKIFANIGAHAPAPCGR
jgi:hypothetical protein